MTTYNIGQTGSAYQELSDINWNALQPGDVVNIHWRPQPYTERLLLNVQGTEDSPITIRGIAGPNGERPVLDSDDATTPVQFANFNLQYRQELGGSIYLGAPGSYPDASEVPAYIIIDGLEVTGAGQGNSFTDVENNVREYGGSAGIYIKGGHDITIENSFIHHNGMGIFSNSNHNHEIVENLLIQNNLFEDNGLSGSYLRHHVYTEGLNTSVIGNTFGDKIEGDQGSLLKMRDVGIVISDNWFGSSPGHIIDLSDVQSGAMDQAGYGTSAAFHFDNVISGNVIEAKTGNIYIGGDSLGKEGPIETETYRKSVDFIDNYVSFESDRSDLWRLGILRAPSTQQTFNIEGNTFNGFAETDGALPTNFALLSDRGNLVVTGANTVAGPISLWADNSPQEGAVSGLDSITYSDDPIDPPVSQPQSNPQVLGTNGDDTIDGTNGDDLVIAQGGEDQVNGWHGDDQLYGNDGSDLITGGVGNDTLVGADGDDTLIDHAGENTLLGGDGADRLFAFSGENTLVGNAHDDLLIGGIGADELNGGSGDDVLSGDISGFLFGNDEIRGGAGNDLMEGGGGADVFVFAPNEGDNIIADLEIDLATPANTLVIGRDFEAGLDRIDISSFGYSTADAALSNLSMTGGQLFFSDQGTTITIFDVDLTEISATNLIL